MNENNNQVNNVVEPVNEVKTSGTATEEEINIDATKEKTEVIDEFTVSQDVEVEKAKFKRNWTFIFIIVIIIVLFIIFLPTIIKKIGM